MGETVLIIAIALAVTGLSLIFMEFFLPSGFLIFIAAILLLGSITSFGFLGVGIGWTIAYVLSLVLLTVGVIAAALNRLRNKVALKDDPRGFQQQDSVDNYIGQIGVVVSDLKPTGYICIGDHQLPAMIDRGYVNQGASVQVVAKQGSTWIVKMLK